MATKIYRVQAPDGSIIRLEGPEGASEEEVIAKAKELTGQKVTTTTRRAAEPTTGASNLGLEGFDLPTDQFEGTKATIPAFLNYLRTQPVLEPFTRQAIRGAAVDPYLAVRQFTPGGGEAVAQAEAEYQAERARLGEDGTEYGRIVGNILSPVPLFAATKAAGLVSGTGRLARVGQAAAAGGAGAALAPILEEDANFVSEKLKQISTGAILGAFLEGNIQGVRGGLNFIREFSKPMTQKGREQLTRDFINKLVGDERETVLQAFRKAEEIVPGARPTAAETIADIPSATAIASMQRRLATAPETAARFAVREAEQEAARLAALGADETTAPLIAALREGRTGPLREEALAQANIAGRIAPGLEADIAARETTAAAAERARQQFVSLGSQQEMFARQPFTPVPGQPRVSSQYRPNFERVADAIEAAKDAGDIAAQKIAEANFKRLQLQSLEDEGFYALKINPVVDRINKYLATPGERSEVAVKTFDKLRQKLTERATQTGVIDSRDLYTLRKEIADDINTFAKETNTSDVRRLAALETNLKKVMDDAIESAGGVRWKDYLKNYADYSEKINRAEIGTYLQDKLRTAIGDKERAGVFALAVQEAANTVKKATGAPRYGTLGEVLNESQLKAVNSVLADLQRAARSGRLQGKASVGGVEAADTPDLPQLLNRVAAIGNFLVKGIKGNAEKEIRARAAELFLDTPALAVFIQQPNAPRAIKAIFGKLPPDIQDFLERIVAVQVIPTRREYE